MAGNEVKFGGMEPDFVPEPHGRQGKISRYCGVNIHRV
jgi:hypothetical protein